MHVNLSQEIFTRHMLSIIVKMKGQTSTTQGEQTAGHIFHSLVEVFYQLLVDGNIAITCKTSGQLRSAPEGVWVQGGGIEIPCL